MERKKAVVIGIGNLILKDEGVGVHVVRELQQRDLPPGVEVMDGGTATMDLLGVIQEAEKVVVVDALRGGGQPGTVYRVSPADLSCEAERTLSLHQVGLLEVLEIAQHLGGHGEVVIIGVEPKEISWGMELTPDVQAKVPEIVEAVLNELQG